jgi:phage protein D
VLLNRDEEVRLFEDMTPSDIVTDLFQQYGLTPEVDNVPGPSGGLSRVIVQRGTAMQLLRELARRHGMFVYVRPGDTPGNSVGVFTRPQTTSSDLPEILVLGANRNVNAFSAYFDALRPLTSRANSVRITDQTLLSSEAAASALSPQGDEAVHDIVTPGVALLARTREDSVDLDAATAAAVDHSSWAYAARAEVVADMYAGVLSPYNVITVSGAGGHLSGDYLISRVTHLLNDENYKQQFTLRRNARSRGGSGGAGSSAARVF